jgi:hypothetical protein
MRAPSLPPGRYFRIHMAGYLEGIDSEGGIVWRCSRAPGEVLFIETMVGLANSLI